MPFRKACQFLQAGRQKNQNSAPAGKGLGGGLRQAKVLGACQDEPTRLRVCVNVGLQVTEKVGDMLDFIQDGALAIFVQKGPRVVSGKIPGIYRFH